MEFSRAVLLVVLICAVGVLSGPSSRRRQVRSPFTPEIQTWVAKAADQQVKLAAKIGRLIKILPPNENETVSDDNATNTRESNPFAFFGTIPLKIVSVVKGTADNKTGEVEEVEPIVAETTEAAVTLPVQVIEIDAAPVEVLPKPQALTSAKIDPSKDLGDEASSSPEISAVTEPSVEAGTGDVADETDSAATETDSVTEEAGTAADVAEAIAAIDPTEEDASDASALGPVARAVDEAGVAEEPAVEEPEVEVPEVEVPEVDVPEVETSEEDEEDAGDDDTEDKPL